MPSVRIRPLRPKIAVLTAKSKPRGKNHQNPRGSGWTRLPFGAETHRWTGTWRSHDAKMSWTTRYFRQYCSCWQGLWFMGKPWIHREPWRWFLYSAKVEFSWSVVHRFLSLQRKASCWMLFHEDQRSSQNRYALRKARLQIPRVHSFGGCTALACIISPADDFGNTP